MDWTIALAIGIGLVALIAGAELLVRGASRLAAAVGISPLVIGLTVVAFGTSSPELAVSFQSASTGSTDVAIGNIVGSNIFNILLILGISASITPLMVHLQLLRYDMPLLLGLSLLLFMFAGDGRVNRIEGMLLFGGLVVYITYGIWKSRRENKALQAQSPEEPAHPPSTARSMVANLAFIAAGLVLLVWGSGRLVDGSVALARLFNVSELVIGLTIVAIGTSTPEVATSVMAAIRKERDIAVGNVVGSNLFNIMGVLGLSALVAPGGIPVADSAIQFDIPVMLVVAFGTLPILFTGRVIARWEGALLLVYFVAYNAFLLFESIQHQGNRQILVTSMLWFVIPFTIGMLAITVIREIRTQRSRRV